MSTLEVVPALPEEPDAPSPDVPAPRTDRTIASGPARWFPLDDPAVGAAVRAHVLLALNLRAVDTDVIADAMVLVSELVTNVHDHTPSEQVGVRVFVDTDRVVVAVAEDRSTDAPFDRRLSPGAPDTAPPADHVLFDERGRGLQIVDAVAAEWGFVRVDRVATAWFALATTTVLGL